MHYIILFLIVGVVLAGAWNFILEIRLRGVLLIESVVLAYVGIFQLIDNGPMWAVWIVTGLFLIGFIALIGYAIYLAIKHFQNIKKTIW